MQSHQLKSIKTSSKKRIGRGGKQGTYSGRGMKGQKARRGYSRRATWEGGRTTLIAATKKTRGFKSRQIKNQVVSFNLLVKHFANNALITPAKLVEKGLIKDVGLPVKILAGSLKKKLDKKFLVQDILYSRSLSDYFETKREKSDEGTTAKEKGRKEPKSKK